MFAIKTTDGLYTLCGAEEAAPMEAKKFLREAKDFEITQMPVWGQEYEILKLPAILTNYSCGQNIRTAKATKIRSLVAELFHFARQGHRCPKCSFEGCVLLKEGLWHCPSCGAEAEEEPFRVRGKKTPLLSIATFPCPECLTQGARITGTRTWECPKCGSKGEWGIEKGEIFLQGMVHRMGEENLICPECSATGVTITGDETWECPTCESDGEYHVKEGKIILHRWDAIEVRFTFQEVLDWEGKSTTLKQALIDAAYEYLKDHNPPLFIELTDSWWGEVKIEEKDRGYIVTLHRSENEE